MEPFMNVAMQTSPCYPFYARMLYCVKGEEMWSRMCYTEMEDWYECKQRKKHRAFNHYIGAEM